MGVFGLGFVAFLSFFGWFLFRAFCFDLIILKKFPILPDLTDYWKRFSRLLKSTGYRIE